MNEEIIRMVLPCECPHCGKVIVVDINQPHPTVSILSDEEVPEEIKNVIEEQYDITEKPTPK